MEYELKHGNADPILIQQALKNGEELPDFIKNKPYLFDNSLQFYLQAFFVLESERQIGFGISSIPITKIIEYARYLGYQDHTDMYDFITIMRELDGVALKHYNKSNAK